MKRFLLILSAFALLMGITTAYARDQQATDEQMSYSHGSTGGDIYYQAPQFQYPPGR